MKTVREKKHSSDLEYILCTYCMICTSTVSNEVMEYILGLPEVNDAKKRIDALDQGSISFHIPSNPVLQSIGIPLSASIPMRWIKGDTKPHIDKGRHLFRTTWTWTWAQQNNIIPEIS